MARPQTNNHLYIGRAGHLAAMSECLARGWNVAIPEVDVGEDIFVVEDHTSRLAKVQVKTATGRKIKKGFKAQFDIPIAQLIDTSQKSSDLRYIFITRHQRVWYPLVIIKREDLLNKHQLEYAGSTTKGGHLILTLYYVLDQHSTMIKIEAGTKKNFSKSDFTSYADNWSIFFPVRIIEGN